MKILTLNVGSSSIKYSLFENKKLILKEQINNIQNREEELKKIIETHKEAEAVAHRIVHGGLINESKKINPLLIEEIKKYCDLAPLHDPIKLEGIEICQKLLPHVQQIAIFDTAFHQTLEPKAFTYALPKEICEKYKIRRYGFHGISHKYIATQTSGKVISCHLGNGCSICAIKDGKSIDTSMGFTPTEGLVMGTRSGDIDPEIIAFLVEKEEIKGKEIRELLNKKSGLLGISGKTNNMQELLLDNSEEAKLAIDVFIYRIVKYIGAYVAAMDGVNEIVFTAGIGENSPEIRKRVCKNLSYLHLGIDEEKNNANEDIISDKGSEVKVKVIKTNEDIIMAEEASKIMKS